MGKTLIMKFGGAAVEGAESFSRCADLVLERARSYERIAIVVSAMGDFTDRLQHLAESVNPEPPRRELDMLVSVGERISISLLAMALAAKGREAVSFTGSQSGILTTESHGAAKIVDVRPERLISALSEGKFVIVAGFQGVSRRKEITTLGRGGSDTSAVALGVALGAEKVEFFKDVAGIYDTFPDGKVLETLSFEQAEEVVAATGGQVLHPRALSLASRNHLPLVVRSYIGEGSGTVIGTRRQHDAPTFE